MDRIHSKRLRLHCGVAACIGALLAVCGAQTAGSSLQQHFQAAQLAQQRGQFDAAAREYKAVLQLQPGLPEAYINLGLVYYAQAKFDASAQALAQAARLRPGMRGVSLWLGIDEVKLHRPAEGVAHLREAIRQTPNDKLAQSWMGTALWDAGQMDAALLQLNKAAAQFPDDPDLLFALGEAYRKAATQQTEQLLEASSGTPLSDRVYAAIYADERQWGKAEGHLRRALERDPRSLDAHLELAQVFVEQGHLATAQEQLDQAAALAPNSASVMARRAQLLLLMRQPAHAIALIEQAMKIDRDAALSALGLPAEERMDAADAPAELHAQCRDAARELETAQPAGPARDIALASLYMLSGVSESATRVTSEIQSGRSSASASADLFSQFMTEFHQHHFDKAEALLVRWIATHPGDGDARYKLIQARRQLSMRQLERLLAIAPDSYHVHQMLGQLYASRDEDEKATAEYLAVVAAQPDQPGIHFLLGHLYWTHGDADHALVELKRELQLDPGHPEANAELGAVLVAEERAQEAIPPLELALRGNPDLWPAYAQLGRAYAIEKNYARAEQVLRRGLDHDQGAEAHYQLGLVLRSEGKTAQAAQIFAEVRALKKEKMLAPTDETIVSKEAKP